MNFDSIKQCFISALDKSDTPNEFFLNTFEEVYKQGRKDGAKETKRGKCGDCKYYRRGSLNFPGHCDYHGIEPNNDWYCADFEKAGDKETR